MSKVFKVWPKRVIRVNGTVLTPEMVIIVTIPMHVSNPFSNGAKEIKEIYMQPSCRMDDNHHIHEY